MTLTFDEVYDFAVVHLELDPERFLDLTLYDWALYVRRHQVKVEALRFAEESAWDRIRRVWVILANQYRDKKKKAYNVTDLIKLSWDKDLTDSTRPRLTSKEMKVLLGSKFKKDGE